MSRLETLRNDAAKYLTALYADESLSNAVALANVANQMIAALSNTAPKVKATQDKSIPSRISHFPSDTKLKWANGEWHSLICGVDYDGDVRSCVGMIYNFAKSVDLKAETRAYEKTVRFRLSDKETAQ